MIEELSVALRSSLLRSRFLTRLRFWVRRRQILRHRPATKLHLGCGRVAKEGFINVDHRKTPAVDFVADIGVLPFPEASVERIESYHVIEHIRHRRVPEVLTEWHRVLQSGGAVVIECPDFDQVVREYMEGMDERIYNIYGLQCYHGDTHFFGYNKARIANLLKTAGFCDIRFEEPTDYHVDEEPCIRVVARKP